MQSLIKYLRSLGGVWSYVAIVITVATTNWPLLVSTIVAFCVSLNTTVLEWVEKPAIQVFAGVFLFSLWTIIGLSILRNRKIPNPVEITNNPVSVRTVHDYAYGLILDGISVSAGRFPKSHPTYPNGDALMLTCNYRNVSQGPLRVRIEHYRVILNNRTNDEDPFQSDRIFSRLQAMGMRSGGVPIDDDDSNLSGTISLQFIYGHPDSDYVRRYHLKVNIQVIIHSRNSDSISVSMDNSGLEIKDDPI